MFVEDLPTPHTAPLCDIIPTVSTYIACSLSAGLGCIDGYW